MSETTSSDFSMAQPNFSGSYRFPSSHPSNLTERVAAKRISFYKSGDPRFHGVKMVVTNRSFKTFDALLDSLSKKVPLPFGVRNITTPRGVHHITNLNELEDGRSYICSQQRKIRPINIELARKKPLMWKSSRPPSVRHRRTVPLIKRNEVSPFPQGSTVARRVSKKMVVFKNGDVGIKHTVVLNMKTMQNFNAFLDYMTEIMEYPIVNLYTTDGRKLLNTQALLLSSGAIVAAGREPFKPRNYDSEQNRLPAILPGISKRVLPKTKPTQESRNTGKWKVTIFTNEEPSAGTSSQVYITLYGRQRNSGPVCLDGHDEDVFQSGQENTFTIYTGDIGELYKIRIGHNNSGQSPSWLCEQVHLQNLNSQEEYYIPVHRWLSQSHDDGEICRELPVLHRGQPILPVTKYEVHVVTDDVWNAGTEANVYICVYGERGDSGSRLLFRSNKTRKFLKGQTDSFQLEAVQLGNLSKIVIGHDGLEAGNGWFLDKVLIKDPIKDMEYTFLCHRWLDQGEDDGRIVRELHVADNFTFPTSQELEMKRKEIWDVERWKFQKGNTVQFYNKAKGRFIRLSPDGTVDALGEKKDNYGLFDVSVKRGNVRVFSSHHIQHLALAIDKGYVSGMEKSGSSCELQIHPHSNHSITLESVRVPGHMVTFNPEGKAAEGYATGYARLTKEFVVLVKGVFSSGAVILLTSSWCQALCPRFDGSCIGTGKQSEESYWRIHKTSSADCMFESVTYPQRFLRIKDGRCDSSGAGDQYCHFKIEKNLENGSVSLESVRNRGMYVGLLPDGETKPLVHTGEKNIVFFPQVIKFGRKKPMGTSATASQPKEVIESYAQERARAQVSRSPSASPPLSKKETRKTVDEETLFPSDDDWKVTVLTGKVGTQANATLWIYGDIGASGPVMLDQNNKKPLFLPGQEDGFQIKMKNVGKIYKIRIGHDGTSDYPEWNLQKVTLMNLKSRMKLNFEVNRWLSRNRGDCNTVCECPVIKDGNPMYPIIKYQVYIYTGHLEQAETDAPIYMCIHGERGDSGMRLLHKSDLPLKFQRGQVDMFRIEAVSLGKLQKVLLRCEANKKSQYWYCEKVVIREPGKDSEYIFNCERWLPFMSQGIMCSETELNLQEMQSNSPSKIEEDVHAGDWKIIVVTGNVQNAGTEATVYLYAFGEKGSSGPIILGSGKYHLFKPNSEDSFKVNLKNLGQLYKIRVGHDNSGKDPGWYLEEIRLRDMTLESDEEMYLPVNRWLAEERDGGDTWWEIAVSASNKDPLPCNGWFLDQVIVKYKEGDEDRKIIFPCDRWLDEYQDDGKTETELFIRRHDESLTSATEKGQWKVWVKTAKDSPEPQESKITLVIYGWKGKTDDLLLSSLKQRSMCFLPGATDEFLVDAEDVGDVYKIRINCDCLPALGWHLKSLRMKALTSQQELNFNSNHWFSNNREDGEMVKEFPTATEYQEPLSVNKYIVSVHIGDHWGAETFANVYLTLYGQQGDTGARKLEKSLIKRELFQRNQTDSFLMEAVSLKQLKKIVIGHDGVGYGAGMYLKMITVQESQDSNTEWVFPCWKWMDSHLRTGQTVLKLKTIGKRLAFCPTLLPKSRNSSDFWTVDIIGSELKSSSSPANLSLVFYGDQGHKTLPLQIAEKPAQIKDELESLGSIYKVQVSAESAQLKEPWHLESLHMKHSGTSQEMYLTFDCWFKPNEEKCVDLPVLCASKDPLPVVEYTVHVYTGDRKNADATGDAYLSIQGERGNTGKRWLNNSDSGPVTFTRGQVHIARIKAVYLGKLNQLLIAFKTLKKDDWFLEKIIVEDDHFPSSQHIFVHNDWIRKHSKKDFTELSIPVQDIKMMSEKVKNFDTVSRGRWNMWLNGTFMSDKMPDIHVVLFGRYGKSSAQKAMNFKNNPFLVLADGIGEIIKVSLVQTGDPLEREIQLQKLRLKDLDTKQELGVHISDKQFFEEDGPNAVAELATFTPDRAPLSEQFYSVSVRTGMLPASETDADIFITIYGTNGDSCKRKLKHSRSPEYFEKGQVNVFEVKAVDLGVLSKVFVGHTNVGYGAGWYLDQITIQDPCNKDIEYLFPCQQWLDSEVGDKQTERELRVLGKVKKRQEKLKEATQGTWNVTLTTSDSHHTDVNAEAALMICCRNGTYGPVLVPKGSLIQGKSYQTSIDIDKKFGAIQKVRLQMEDAKDGDRWHCCEVKLQHKQTGEILEFPFFQTLEGCTAAERPVLISGCNILTVKKYFLDISTGQASKSGTEAEVYVTLSGTMGDTGRRKLTRKGDHAFTKEKVDAFRMEAVDIGQLKELTVEKGKGSDWQLEKIVVREEAPTMKTTVFMAQTWLKDGKSKTTSVTLHPKDYGNEVTQSPGKQQMKSDGKWKISLTMGQVGGVGQHKDSKRIPSNLVIVLYGGKGKSETIKIASSEEYQANHSLKYEVHLPSDLGELYKVRLGLESLSGDIPKASLLHFKMQNKETLDTFSHTINKTLPLSFNGDRWIEIPIEWPLKPSHTVVTYHITVFNSPFKGKRHAPLLTVCLYGSNGDTGSRHLHWPGEDVEHNGKLESFTAEVDAVELGELNRIDVSIKSQNYCALHMKRIHVKEAMKQDPIYVFDVNEEFSLDANVPEIRRKVTLSSVINEEGNELDRNIFHMPNGKNGPSENIVDYLVKVYTGDLRGAGTDANVHITLFGSGSSSKEIQLTKSLEHHDPFERGKVDTFKIMANCVGKLERIEIGHDGKGFGSGWFLERVEITDLSTDETYSFSCKRWLAKDENDGSTVVELHSDIFS
uniref:Oxygen-regulated protein 1 isoform X2 n=1 Tax=Geotrypetes seraphini TaxID=260995 RepID=A0A6P8Q3G5_GEOSA|nr:oxygen-regulated protein 1 isoform X2 [Geotrypetes seraphini]